MNRLTRKIKGYYSVDLRTCLPMEYEQIENSNACVDKLGKLEDIEEELGIDLITLFKALKDGFYFKYKDKILSSNDYFLQITVDLRDNWTFDIISGHLSLLSIKFKDYNKTWALDKQTLEK